MINLSVITKESNLKEKFIEKSIKIHKDLYNYLKTEYKNNKAKVKIICNNCKNIFEQIPSNHLRGHGCPNCNNVKLNTRKFIEKSIKTHFNKYNYSQTEYINATTKVKIICHVHGLFEQEASSHMRGYGCIKCGIDSLQLKRQSNTEEFVEKIHKIHRDKYDYSQVEYINNDKKIKIICKEHGFFLQTPKIHLQGSGCPQCPCIISKPHKKVIDFLLEQGLKEHIDFIINNKKEIKPFELDIFLPKYKLAIEIDGVYWHGKLESCKQDRDYLLDRDYRKNKICEQNNIKLLRFTDIEINKNFSITKEKILSFI